MLPISEWGERPACRGPLVVMCHWLGGSAQTWSLLAERLAERGMRCVAVDLPGFGAAANLPGYSVRAMADAVIATVREVRQGERELPWLLAGHSMGGKVAMVVAHEAVNGAAGLQGLRGVVLLSPSPPGPEPMTESERADKLKLVGESTGDDAQDRAHAETFVKNNVGAPSLGTAVRNAAIDGVLQADKAAIRAWFEGGSREDWRAFVGELALPALVFAGSDDVGLSPDVQRTQTLPCFAPQKRTAGVEGGELVVLEGAGHLAPLEQPGAVAERIVEFCAELGLPVQRKAAVGEWFGALVASEKTSPQTRSQMDDRLAEDDAAYASQVLGRKGLRVLRELARRVVPGAGFDVAARVDRRLAAGAGDGWRPAELPEDAAAWRRGLHSLDAGARRAHGVGFVELTDELQDGLLDAAAQGKLGEGWGGRLMEALGFAAEAGEDEVYSAAEMKSWFGEVRGELAKLYMADPRTMEQVGFTGFADEGGFTQIRLGEREVWER